MKQMGEIIVDHRASPGLPEDVARWAGYDPRFCKEGKIYKQETLHCSHCDGHGIKNIFRTRERHYCAKCAGHYICDACAFLASQPGYVHTPYKKVVDDLLTVAVMGSPPKLLIP